MTVKELMRALKKLPADEDVTVNLGDKDIQIEKVEFREEDEGDNCFCGVVIYTKGAV
jgi:hypothetical protein